MSFKPPNKMHLWATQQSACCSFPVNQLWGTSVAQWLLPLQGGMGLIPGQGNPRSCMPSQCDQN